MSRQLEPRALLVHTDRLYRAAWALCGSREDAEDLVQETFARVLSRPRQLRGESELGYLLTALRNVFLSNLRTAGRRPRTAAIPDGFDPVDPQRASRPEAALETRDLFHKIAALPENHRLALVAVDIAGLSYREAGRALGIREATVATRLFRARQQLAARLADDGEATAPSPTTTGATTPSARRIREGSAAVRRPT